MIFLWGIPTDSPMTAVCDALYRLNVPVAFFDQRKVLDTEIELVVGSTVEGIVRAGDQQVDLSQVTAAYMRPYDARRLPEIERAGENSPEWVHALNVEDALLSWAELTSAVVVNRPTAMAANNSKPYQAAQIQSFGFRIPETLVTTDSNAVREFWERHGIVIYKSISGVRSIVSRLTDQHLERLANISWCPTQFQQYIPGHDFRVHVVGNQVFTCEVISEADDYRYATRQGAVVEIRPYDLPKNLADRCRESVAAMHLLVAGLDLRCTPDGQWYCFEVNPSPGFSYYQEATNQPIAEAIAQLLTADST